MLKLKKGCSVPFPEKLCEQFEVRENRLIANVGTDKIMDMLIKFIDMHNEPLFFILEIPTNANEEKENCDTLHKDVFYIDGCTQEKMKEILDIAGELLIDDGMNCFGIGCHYSKEEILFEKYNVVTIFSKNSEKYEEFFKAHNISKTSNLITAWQTFSKEHYGECEICTVDNKDIYSLPEKLKQYGIYFAERRED